MQKEQNINLMIKYAPIISGCLIGLSFPPNPLGSLFIGIGFVPLLYAIKHTKSYKEVFRKSYFAMLIFMLLSSWWMGSWQANSDRFLIITCAAFITFHPFFYLPAFIFYKYLFNKKNQTFALVGFTVFWCFGEYLHSLTEASYPWLTIGNAHTYSTKYIQFIEYTGVWGLSLVSLLQNIILVKIMFLIDDFSELDKVRNRIKIIIGNKRKFWKHILILILTVVIPLIFGNYKLNEDKNFQDKISVGIVQPNINPWDKWKEESQNQILVNAEQTRKISHDYTAKKNKKLDMILWVETAIPYPLRHKNNTENLLLMNSFVDSLQIPILSGFADYEVYDKKENVKPSSRHEIVKKEQGEDTVFYDYFNSTGMFVPTKGIYDIYHKSQLVPFGERIPFIDEFPSLAAMLTWGVGISAWGKGDSTKPLKLNDSTKVGAVICIESIYPELVSQFVNKGAELLTIVTNDGWYLGTPGPIQHNQFAVLRAVENRRAVARAANTGISSFINSNGEILAVTKEGIKTELAGELELRSDKTFYTNHGGWLPKLCGLITLVVLAIAIILPAKK